MLRHGIDLNWTFRYSCAPAYGLGDAPESERAARTLLGLPTYPSLATSAAARICKVLRDFVGAAR